MEFIAAFKDFGFAALVTGVLLWLYATKLEKIVIANEAMAITIANLTNAITELKGKVDGLENKVDGVKNDVVAMRENTRPKGGRQT